MLGVHQAACYRDVMEGRTGNTWTSQVCNRAWRLLSAGPRTLSPHLPLSPMLPASMSWQEVPRLRKRNQNVGFILAWPASAPPFPEMEARLTTLRICLSDLPCAERPELADGATGWAHCGPGVRSMPCYIGGGMCVL